VTSDVGDLNAIHYWNVVPLYAAIKVYVAGTPILDLDVPVRIPIKAPSLAVSRTMIMDSVMDDATAELAGTIVIV
jgi:hypothetical protein